MAKVGKGYQVGLSWVPLMEGKIPPRAIDIGDRVFVARGRIDGGFIPGKYVEKYGTCYVSHGGVEHELGECEILCDTSILDGCCYEWKEDNGGGVPKHAIVGGIAEDGQPLYVCKAEINGEECAGKVHNGHSCGYVPHGGVEHSVDDYKVLCLRKN